MMLSWYDTIVHLISELASVYSTQTGRIKQSKIVDNEPSIPNDGRIRTIGKIKGSGVGLVTGLSSDKLKAQRKN